MRERFANGAAVALGAAGWTVLEYGLHRFAMHALRGRGLASVEHLKHHADVTYFSPASKKAASAVGTTALVFPLASLAVGRRRATAFTAGLIGTYYAYEVAHRRTHTHPPRGRYSRWTRRNHMHHHFGAPMRNFGVTTPLWDRAFGSYENPGVVSVPRRMAPAWMIDASGAVRPELAGDYTVRAGAARNAAQAQRDRSDAFANTAPAL